MKQHRVSSDVTKKEFEAYVERKDIGGLWVNTIWLDGPGLLQSIVLTDPQMEQLDAAIAAWKLKKGAQKVHLSHTIEAQVSN